MVFGRKIRALNIKAVADFVKFIDNLIEIFNQIQHIGAKVGNQVLFVKPAFNVTAGDVGVVFYLFDLFVELFVFVAALFGQINADGFFLSHSGVNDFIVEEVYFAFQRFGLRKQRQLDVKHSSFPYPEQFAINYNR